MNQATARHHPRHDDVDVSLAGLVPAQTLYNAVCADPSAPLAVCISAPGGYGKSALLAALRQAYLVAGVSVVGTSAVPIELT
ncbi:MAG: hypothetical protein ACRDRD_04930, partial [Pseudonocardiaceae bacterium]